MGKSNTIICTYSTFNQDSRFDRLLQNIQFTPVTRAALKVDRPAHYIGRDKIFSSATNNCGNNILKKNSFHPISESSSAISSSHDVGSFDLLMGNLRETKLSSNTNSNPSYISNRKRNANNVSRRSFLSPWLPTNTKEIHNQSNRKSRDDNNTINHNETDIDYWNGSASYLRASNDISTGRNSTGGAGLLSQSSIQNRDRSIVPVHSFLNGAESKDNGDGFTVGFNLLASGVPSTASNNHHQLRRKGVTSSIKPKSNMISPGTYQPSISPSTGGFSIKSTDRTQSTNKERGASVSRGVGNDSEFSKSPKEFDFLQVCNLFVVYFYDLSFLINGFLSV